MSVFWSGVLAGVIAAGIAWGIGRTIRWGRNLNDFGRLAGEYRVIEKQGRTDGTVIITGNGSQLGFIWTMRDKSTVEGTLAMNEQSRVTGAGSYTHSRGESYGWGDLSFQVAARKRGAIRLLVDGRFTNTTSRSHVASAWVWEMVAPSPAIEPASA